MDSILAYSPGFFEEMNESSDKKKVHRTDLIQSVGLQFAGNLHPQWFNMFMMDLLKKRAADLYRTKGLLSFHGQGNTKFVFQGVHEQINFGPANAPWKDGEERMNRFVFIGKNLDRKWLTKSLMECLYQKEEIQDPKV
jgi:G3E family GTPase